jgi:hypothetical protein
MCTMFQATTALCNNRQAAEGVQLIAELPPPKRPFLAEA